MTTPNPIDTNLLKQLRIIAAEHPITFAKPDLSLPRSTYLRRLQDRWPQRDICLSLWAEPSEPTSPLQLTIIKERDK